MHSRLLAVASLALLAGIAAAPAATLVDRYLFQNNVSDSLGAANGTATANAATTEAPAYVADAPTGAAGSTTSLSLGATAGTKASGFSLANSVLDKTSGALSFWINPQQTTDAGADYVLYLPGATGGLALYLSANSLNLRAYAGNSTSYAVSSVTAGNWLQVALTWDATTGTSQVYLGGVLAASGSYTAGTLLTSSAGLRIGGFDLSGTANLTDQFVGKLYDLQVYSGALSSTDVSYLNAHPGLAVPEPGTVALLLGGLALLGMLGRRAARAA